MGGAQPLAVTMNDGVAICIECDQHRIDRRLETRYLDVQARDLDHALELALEARDERRGAVDRRPRQRRRGAARAPRAPPRAAGAGRRPLVDIVTDQTSAHDPLFYLPAGTSYDDWERERTEDPRGFTKRSQESMARHVRAMVELQDAGAEVFDYGNSIRDEARKGGYDRAFEFPGFVPAYIRPLFCEGKGPFRWAALSGDPEDIYATDRAIKELFPADEKPEYARLHAWLDMASERVQFQGLPARICWLGYGDRAKAGAKFNEMVASGELKAPIVIGRDHLDCGSVASPYRETEAMLDGSDAIADWAILNALVNTASGATWVSFHHGGGVGIGRSLHAGQVTVADGTDLAAEKIERVLTNDPGMGVIRHVDAGYDRAVEVADERGVRIPMSGRPELAFRPKRGDRRVGVDTPRTRWVDGRETTYREAGSCTHPSPGAPGRAPLAAAAVALAAAGTMGPAVADPDTTPGGPWPQGGENTNAIRSYEQLWSTLESIEGRAQGSFDLSPAPLPSNTGREIPVVTIGDGDTDIMFVANQHGDEYIVSNAMISVVRGLAGGSAEARAIRDALTVTIVPRVNVDGFDADVTDLAGNTTPWRQNFDTSCPAFCEFYQAGAATTSTATTPTRERLRPPVPARDRTRTTRCPRRSRCGCCGTSGSRGWSWTSTTRGPTSTTRAG